MTGRYSGLSPGQRQAREAGGVLLEQAARRRSRALDPGLTAEDFADAGQRLDHLADDRFAPCGLTPDDVTRLRKRFAAWLRTPGHRPSTVPDVPPARLAHGQPYIVTLDLLVSS